MRKLHRPKPNLVSLPVVEVEDGGDENLWDVERAAAFLGMSASWVYRSAEGGTLPCRRIGNRLRFVPRELRAWVDKQIT